MGKKEEVGASIRAMRLAQKMTQADLAKRIHQSPSSITMYETGRREPDFETLEAIADVFNIPLFLLVDMDEKASPVSLSPAAQRRAKLHSVVDQIPDDKADLVIRILESILADAQK